MRVIPGTPRPQRSWGLTIAAILVVATAIALAAVAAIPELRDRASLAVSNGVNRITHEEGPENPLHYDIEQWRAEHPQDARSLDEHLEAARRISAEDAWRSSEAAEVETKLALFLDANNARALSFYVENRVMWRDELLAPAERTKLESAIEYASQRAPESADVQRASAVLARSRGEVVRCAELAEKVLAKTPNDVRARLELARCMLEREPDRAIENAERVKKAVPDLREADRVLARAYANVGRYKAAFALLDDRLKSDRSNGRALRLRADLERELGRWETAEKLYQLAATAEPDNPLPRLALGTTQLALEKHKSAAAIFKLVTINRSAPEHLRAAAQTGAARAQLLLGELDRAAENAAAAVALRAEDPVARLVHAEISLEKGALADAKLHADRAIGAARHAPGPLVMRARVSWEEKKRSEALADLAAAVKLNPSDVRLRAVLAGAAFAAKSEREALAAIEGAQRMDPSGVYAFQADEGLDVGAGVFRTAVEQLERAVARGGEHAADASVALGMLQYQLGNRVEAVTALQRAETATTADRIALAYEAQMAIEDGSAAKAEREVKTLLGKDPTSPIAQLLLARLEGKRQNVQAAREAYQAALDRAPDLLAAQCELAAIQLEGPGKETALRVLAEIYRRNPRVLRLRQLLAEAGY